MVRDLLDRAAETHERLTPGLAKLKKILEGHKTNEDLVAENIPGRFLESQTQQLGFLNWAYKAGIRPGKGRLCRWRAVESRMETVKQDRGHAPSYGRRSARIARA